MWYCPKIGAGTRPGTGSWPFGAGSRLAFPSFLHVGEAYFITIGANCGGAHEDMDLVPEISGTTFWGCYKISLAPGLVPDLRRVPPAIGTCCNGTSLSDIKNGPPGKHRSSPKRSHQSHQISYQILQIFVGAPAVMEHPPHDWRLM